MNGGPGASESHPSSRVMMEVCSLEDIELHSSAQSEASTEVRQLLSKMDRQFAFGQKGGGANEPRNPKFDC